MLLKSYKRGLFQKIIVVSDTSEYSLKDIVSEYNEKTQMNMQYPILSSTMSGIILQSTYFNKQTASENTIGYKIVPRGYFTYRSMSDTGEFHFNCQNIIDQGIVSPAYPVFKINDLHNSRFVEYILNETDSIKAQLLVAKEGGTRYALSFNKFLTLKINLPIKQVQDKIADLIVLFDSKIALSNKILKDLVTLKFTLLQQLFI